MSHAGLTRSNARDIVVDNRRSNKPAPNSEPPEPFLRSARFHHVTRHFANVLKGYAP